MLISHPNLVCTDEEMFASVVKPRIIRTDDGVITVMHNDQTTFRTQRKVARTGVLIAGIGGNNGSSFVATVLAMQRGLSWRTREGVRYATDLFGSVTQSSYIDIAPGIRANFEDVIPMLLRPIDIVAVDGWDISGVDLGEAMARAGVLPPDLQTQLYDSMAHIHPRPAPYDETYIDVSQKEYVDNAMPETRRGAQVEQIRTDIRNYREQHNLDTVIVLWSGSTERSSPIINEVNDTAGALMRSICSDDSRIAPSTLFGVASVLEKCPFVNCSAQQTFVPGLVLLARQHNVIIAGNDLKTGQTKLKAAISEMYAGAGFQPTSIVSFNHLGNRDGENLAGVEQLASKAASKATVVELTKFPRHVKPDHVVDIKYVPSVGDTKRAIDEYVSDIAMGGKHTMLVYQTCEDTLLAVPLMIDIVIMIELLTRVDVRAERTGSVFAQMSQSCIDGIMSYFFKHPISSSSSVQQNDCAGLAKQRRAIDTFLKHLVGLV